MILNAIPSLVSLIVKDTDEGVRRKAAYALSSEIRNYQPGTDAAVRALPIELNWTKAVNAGDMDEVDELMEMLKKWSRRLEPAS